MNKPLILLTSLFLVHCSNPPSTTGPPLDGDDPEEILEMEPEWYTRLEPQEGYTVGKGEGTSPARTISSLCCRGWAGSDAEMSALV